MTIKHVEFPPVLSPAQTRAANKLRAYIQARNAPLAPYAESIVRWSEHPDFRVGWRFTAAVAGLETEFGKTGNAVGLKNPFGIGPHWTFDSWDHSTVYFCRLIRTSYLDKGLTTIAAVGGKYCPGSQHWITQVTAIYKELGGKGMGVS